MRKVLITGASGGIGRALVQRFHGPDQSLALFCHRHPEELQELAKDWAREGIHVGVYAVDLADAEALEGQLRTALEDFGHFDVFVHNAGMAQQELLTDLSLADWDRMLAVNLRSAFICSRLLSPGMLRQGAGRQIYVSSIWGQKGAALEAHYAASKAALMAFGKSLAQELGPSGITVNTVCPGVIQTEMLASFGPEELRSLREETPLGRLGRPEDVAALVHFLASEEAAFITGEDIRVDGGFAI